MAPSGPIRHVDHDGCRTTDEAPIAHSRFENVATSLIGSERWPKRVGAHDLHMNGGCSATLQEICSGSSSKSNTSASSITTVSPTLTFRSLPGQTAGSRW